MVRVTTCLPLPLLLMAGAAIAAVIPNFGPDFNRSTEDNMNGDYVFSATPGATPGMFPKKYRDYPGGAESFEVYSPPITTLYSQVWWSPLDPAPFPDYIVKKYAGKGMAIIGWEIDQVRRTPDGDVSVPISATYNHHYGNRVVGAGAQLKKVMLSGPEDPRAADLIKASHGMVDYTQPQYIAEQVKESVSGHPVSVIITSGNGGEYRKTYHGFAPGYAVVVDSPTAVQITPMQIDTWNRAEMNISGPLPPKFVPGPLPAASQAPKDNPRYSGLLECPMTTRLTKVIDGTYEVQSAGVCGEPIMTFQECYHAAASTIGGNGQSFVNSTGSDATRPEGCTATANPTSPLVVDVFFNTLTSSKVGCGASVTKTMGMAKSLVEVGVELDAEKKTATITMTGPSGVWFGVGFGAGSMSQEPWTVVVNGNGTVSEHKLGNHVAGEVLKPSVTVVSSSVTGEVRTAVVTRALEGASSDYFTFNVTSADATVPFINAVGSGPEFAYHKDKAIGSMSFLPVGPSIVGACVCPEAPKPFGQASGTLTYHAVANQTADVGTGAVGFHAGKCAQYPTTVLNEQQNPTCDIRHYRGGQWACHHMWSLLDAEQEIPWADQPLVFHHKYRFWVQPYTEGYHQPVVYGGDTTLVIGSPYEYDVPKCAEGVAGCSFVNGTWIHTITGSKTGDHHFTSLNFHCHAPTCLSMSVYACPAGTSLQDCNATTTAEAEAKGFKLLCRQEPVYGGTSDPALNGTRFDEPGYIAIPDCFWGSKDQGLVAPVNVKGVPLFMIKTANATIGHYGEMAGGQPFVF